MTFQERANFIRLSFANIYPCPLEETVTLNFLFHPDFYFSLCQVESFRPGRSQRKFRKEMLPNWMNRNSVTETLAKQITQISFQRILKCQPRAQLEFFFPVDQTSVSLFRYKTLDWKLCEFFYISLIGCWMLRIFKDYQESKIRQLVERIIMPCKMFTTKGLLLKFSKPETRDTKQSTFPKRKDGKLKM